MRHFKILELPNGVYIIKKRNFFYQYTSFTPIGCVGLYDTPNECICCIHRHYYPDECNIKLGSYE